MQHHWNTMLFNHWLILDWLVNSHLTILIHSNIDNINYCYRICPSNAERYRIILSVIELNKAWLSRYSIESCCRCLQVFNLLPIAFSLSYSIQKIPDREDGQIAPKVTRTFDPRPARNYLTICSFLTTVDELLSNVVNVVLVRKFSHFVHLIILVT